MGKPQSQETASAMKYLWILVLFSVAFAEPEAEADPNAAADPNAEADPWLLYGGLRHYGYYPRYYGHYGLGYGHGLVWGRKKREAEAAPIAAADPNAVADPNAEADPYLLYGGYYGLGHHGYYCPDMVLDMECGVARRGRLRPNLLLTLMLIPGCFMAMVVTMALVTTMEDGEATDGEDTDSGVVD